MNRQDACSTRKVSLCGTGILPVLENGAGSPAHPTRKFSLCGTGILPVLENGARCELKPTQKLIGKSF
jgi:hypothetical protein